MSDIIIVGDMHFGVRGDSPYFREAQRNWWHNVLIPSIKEFGIKSVIFTGDFTDKRKGIDWLTGDLIRKDLTALSILADVHIIVGNHDTYYKHTNEVNSLDVLELGKIDNVYTYSEPETVIVEGLAIDMIPWINKENHERTMDFVESSDSKCAVGHFEFVGFEMYAGIPAIGGMCPKFFMENYDQIWSGHYHTRSNSKNVTYVGTAVEYTWSDYNDPKGFHVLDSKTCQLLFYPNETRLFEKLHLSELMESKEDPDVRGKIVKLFVAGKGNKREQTMISLLDSMAHELTCINIDTASDLPEEFGDMDAEDTLKVLLDAIKDSGVENPDDMQELAKSVYAEAVDMGSAGV